MPLYTLKIVADFAAAHTLRDYPGPCSRMHGHNWKIEVQASARELDAHGMVVDFKVLRQATREISDRLDHQYLNEIAPFDALNPTAENIAAYFHQQLQQRLNDDRIRIDAVTVWETERACATYATEAL